MASILDLVKDINNQYSTDINHYKNVDDKQGTFISSSLSKAQKNLTDNVNSCCNEFIDKVSAANGYDNFQYYLPSSNHNIVNALA